MTEEQAEMEAESSITTKDLKLLESDIVDKIAALLQPINQQLNSINTALSETTPPPPPADCAMDLALSLQDDSRALQYEQGAMRQKMLSMEIEARAFDVKIHGMPEQAGLNTDLQAFISGWMATELQLEEEIAPCLTKAYRIEALNNPKRQGPRDITVTFLNMRDRMCLMSEARRRGHLNFKRERFEIFQDLPMEVITMRRGLRPITQQLPLANRRYRWIGSDRLQTICNGTPLIATNMESGLTLLNSLGLTLPTDYAKKNFKRKLDLTATPPKGSKIPIRTPT